MITYSYPAVDDHKFYLWLCSHSCVIYQFIDNSTPPNAWALPVGVKCPDRASLQDILGLSRHAGPWGLMLMLAQSLIVRVADIWQYLNTTADPATPPLAATPFSQATADDTRVTASAACCGGPTSSGEDRDWVVLEDAVPGPGEIGESCWSVTESDAVDVVDAGDGPNTAGRPGRDGVLGTGADVDEGGAYGAGPSSRPPLGRSSRKGRLGWTGQGRVCRETPIWSFSSEGMCRRGRRLRAFIGSSEIITQFSSKGREIVGSGSELKTVQVGQWINPYVHTAPGSYVPKSLSFHFTLSFSFISIIFPDNGDTRLSRLHVQSRGSTELWCYPPQDMRLSGRRADWAFPPRPSVSV